MLFKECRVEQIWLRTGDAMADVLIEEWEMLGFHLAILSVKSYSIQRC